MLFALEFDAPINADGGRAHEGGVVATRSRYASAECKWQNGDNETQK
jgi:hypothetical protein